MLVEAKKYEPKCKTAYLYPIYGQVVRRWFFQPLHLAKKIGCDAMHPHKAFATKTLVKRAHAAGMKVNAWTVDEEKDVIQMLIKVPQSKSPAVFLLFADAQFVGCGDSTHRCRDSGFTQGVRLRSRD